MPEAALQQSGLSHAVFLHRMGDDPSSPEARLGQGSFLALRLVDLLAPDRDPPVHPDAFRYQYVATERYINELMTEGPEAAFLQKLVEDAGQAFRAGDVRVVIPAILAYAHCREEAGAFEEEIDVTETALRVGRGRMLPADEVASWLRLGRARRVIARFAEANAAYTAAEESAREIGDQHSQLLSRIGRAIVLDAKGNLGEAEEVTREILADSQTAGIRDAEARAEHLLGGLLHARGQAAEGVPHLWRAHELYEDETGKLRALADLGLALGAIGRVLDAERALTQVANRTRQPDSRHNALIELMHCASARRDRLTFARLREECEARDTITLPNLRVDFRLKAGIGYARFGNYSKAQTALEDALGLARSHGLHEFEFRIDRILNGLGDCERACKEDAAAAAEPVWQTEELEEVSASLALLGSGA